MQGKKEKNDEDNMKILTFDREKKCEKISMKRFSSQSV